MVETYTEEIIDMFVHGYTPRQICEEIKLCDQELDEQSLPLLVQEAEDAAQEQQEERPYCQLCEYAIGEVDRMLEDKQNEDEIKDALDRICYMLT